MNPQQIADLIQRGLPGSRASVSSEDNVHFEAVVIAEKFRRLAAPFSATSWCTPRWAGDGRRDPRARAQGVHGRRNTRTVDKLQIQGGIPLEGEIRMSGAKNATLGPPDPGGLASWRTAR